MKCFFINLSFYNIWDESGAPSGTFAAAQAARRIMHQAWDFIRNFILTHLS